MDVFVLAKIPPLQSISRTATRESTAEHGSFTFLNMGNPEKQPRSAAVSEYSVPCPEKKLRTAGTAIHSGIPRENEN